MLTPEEQDRLLETMFYLYFHNKQNDIEKRSSLFWQTITTLCSLYDINTRAITQSVRILVADENVPSDEEMYYLFSKVGLSVRPIRKITKIYWQRQRDFAKKFETTTPTITRRITDTVYKYSIRAFVDAIYDISGVFSDIDRNLIFGGK